MHTLKTLATSLRTRPLAMAAMFVAAIGLEGCAAMGDFTTFFNIYYNADRIMREIEEPAETQETTSSLPGQSRAPAKAVVRAPEYYDQLIRNPMFDAAHRVISGTVTGKSNAAAQTVKLDSVITKCTKILKFHSNSSYVPPSLYMLAKAFYYKGRQTDFLYSKQKAEEFIQLFPDHEMTVDAHLLLAEDLIALKDLEEARRALSRCIDIALPRKRYDVVSKALRYTADLALQRGDLEGAVRPYLHAMLLSHDDEVNATWQLEIGSLNLITGHDADAAQAFRDVSKYDPDLFTEFSSRFGLGVALRQLHQFDAAKKQLEDVRDKHAYAQWKAYADMELASVRWARGETSEAAEDYQRVDTGNTNAEVAWRAVFEWGVRAMLAGDYGVARQKFQRVRTTMVPFAREAERLYNVLAVGDAASRDMITLEARLAGPDSTSPLPAPNPRPYGDTVRTTPSIVGGQAPALSPGAVAPVPPGADSTLDAKRTRDSIAAEALVQQRRHLRDSTRNALAAAYYEVGRMYLLLGHEDSMVAYYQRIIALGGTGDATATTLYSYALYLQERGREPEKVDTLMQAIIDRFPRSKFLPMARMHFGLTDEERVDSAEMQYVSGERFLGIHDDTTAIRRFLAVASTYPKSDYAPQALYATGWVFESEYAQYDSARYYYAQLVKQYPNSEHARRVKPLLALGGVDTTRRDTTGSGALHEPATRVRDTSSVSTPPGVRTMPPVNPEPQGLPIQPVVPTSPPRMPPRMPSRIPNAPPPPRDTVLKPVPKTP